VGDFIAVVFKLVGEVIPAREGLRLVDEDGEATVLLVGEVVPAKEGL